MRQRVPDYEGVDVRYGLSALLVGLAMFAVRFFGRRLS